MANPAGLEDALTALDDTAGPPSDDVEAMEAPGKKQTWKRRTHNVWKSFSYLREVFSPSVFASMVQMLALVALYMTAIQSHVITSVIAHIPSCSRLAMSIIASLPLTPSSSSCGCVIAASACPPMLPLFRVSIGCSSPIDVSHVLTCSTLQL